MSSCGVCGAPEAESHFGGISCRACAAFFRRYFHSKKSVISCTCQIRFRNSHPCRECRIQKCLSIGMTQEKVQHKREKHPVKKATSLSPASSSSSPGLLSPRITVVSRDSSNISYLVSKWVKVQDKRRLLYGKRLDEITYYDACQATKIDCEIMWDLIETVIPDVAMLSKWDKDTLLRNFHPKWSLLVAAIDFEKNQHAYVDINTIEAYNEMIVRFYTGSLYEDTVLEPEEILRVFEPFLQFYGLMLALPICAKKFNVMEYMALAMMCLFDGAHTNLSPQLADLCHNIRNQILRELRAYHSNLESSGEMRFIETIETLLLMEKGESKFREELLLLEMYNVHIHEDYRLMIQENNY